MSSAHFHPGSGRRPFFGPVTRAAPLLLPLIFLVACAEEERPAVDSPQAEVTFDMGGELGTVDFPTSCSDAAQPHLERGLLLLHHMMYPHAAEAFAEAERVDMNCAMAHWGLAMSEFQPFWGSADVEAGRLHAERALALDPPTDRERGYVEAVAAFYRDPEAGYADRIRSWEAAMAELHQSVPDDPEAAALYALAHLSVAPGDARHQERAQEIVERVHAELPRHPGAIHYAIHVHDVDARAEDGVSFARAYEDIAPSIPHALHMPSHIYVRLGDWEDVIEWNRRSADAALQHPAGEYVSVHYPHALDYLTYGYLQRGEDEAARQVWDELAGHENFEPHFASAYALAAIPARWYVERRDWAGAAELESRIPAEFAWDAYPGAEAMTYFARGLGAAHLGDVDGARNAAQRLEALEAAAWETDDAYWARQIEVQRRGVGAWIMLAEGLVDEAVAEMREAAAMAGEMEKSPVTPGDLQPADELLGDLLLEAGRPAEALAAYETSLDTWPGRFHSVLGAARAADAMGDAATAEQYRQELAELAPDADPSREAAAERS